MSKQTQIKAALRHEFETRLASFDPASAQRTAARVAERVLHLPEIEDARRIMCCLSFGTELDTWALVDRLLASGRQVYVPRVERRGRRLHVHAYPCDLETLGFGLRQPEPSTESVADDQIDNTLDAVLVLGMAFDHQGYRLGHGGGYFDRFLAGRPFPAIALAYDFQVLDRIPAEPHDIPMSVVVTETQTLRPAPSSPSVPLD